VVGVCVYWPAVRDDVRVFRLQVFCRAGANEAGRAEYTRVDGMPGRQGTGDTTVSKAPAVNFAERPLNLNWLFSKRKRASEEAEEWCRKQGCSPCPFNIVTALSCLGYLSTYSETNERTTPTSGD